MRASERSDAASETAHLDPDAVRLFDATPRFTPLAFIGRGAMGVVYRVRDCETDSEVALKTFSLRSPEQLYRLKREFRLLADTAHPNLVELYELIVAGESSFFTMELVDGTDFVRYTRPDERCDLPRLAAAGAQLADGLAAVHAAGKLHRDVKPSNILVGTDGRVVLLDFGLATALGFDTPQHYATAGTLMYMCPEVLFGETPTPAADWYSIGTVLHEALTGRLPFDGSILLGDRREVPPPRLKEIDPLVPDDWEEAVARLLDPDPQRRGEGVEILRRLGGASQTHTAGVGSSRTFVGRHAELERLHQVLDAVGRDGAAVAHLVGPSGIGKSELLRRFLADVEATDGGGPSRRVVVLRGRCHPQEAIAYKAFDGIIDALSRFLMTAGDAAAMATPDTAALLRLFPVLERVPAFARGDGGAEAQPEPHELRRRGLAALRTLLGRIADQARLILWIDDLQWSDLDSMLLLRELLRPPGPPLLMLLSYRSEDEAAIPLLDQVRDEHDTARSLRIDLRPLDGADAAALARRLCAAEQDSDPRVAAIVAEAGGNPFLVGELARSLSGGRNAVHLGDIVAERLLELGEPARLLLEMVSVAGSPLRRSIALDAAGMGERGRPLVSTLEKRSLLRTTTLRDQMAVEIYHDRIREALLTLLSPEKLHQRHGALADVLEKQDEPDADALYRHHLGAGRAERAGEWAVEAADGAAEALAFQRAAELYGAALSLRPELSPRWPLQERQATALANAGRALEAAQTYHAASREVERVDADDAHAMVLRQRAATHYLQTGHLDEGLAVTRQVLADVGVPYPRNTAQAMVSSIVQRTRLAWRGLRFEPRRDELPAPTRRRLDACWGAAISLTVVDQAAADGLGVRYLIEALDSGDPIQISRALGAEAAKTSQVGGRYLRRRCQRLVGIMKGVVDAYGGHYERAHFHVISGMVAFQAAQWRLAHRHLSEAAAILRQHCIGVNWELVTTEVFAFGALAQLGELGQLARQLPDALGDAEDRGDLYGALLFQSGVLNLMWLAQDRPAEALAVAENAMARWPASEMFQIQHYVHLIAVAHADLYRGDPWSAFARVQAAWPKLRAALFLALESPRVELRNLRARCALAAATADAGSLADGAVRPDPKWPRERLLRLAEGDAKQLARDTDVASAAPFATMIEAGVAATRGRDEVAAGLFAEAEKAFAEIEMGLYAAAAHCRCGEINGGECGAARRATGFKKLAVEGVSNPTALLRVFSPWGGPDAYTRAENREPVS